MELTPIQQQALARWHDLGTTTPTHPILQFAYDLYYAPMGIKCDALVYDALATLQNFNNQVTIVNPRFDPKKVDREWGQFKIIEPLLGLTEILEPLFAENGSIQEFTLLRDLNYTDENNSMMSTFVDGMQEKRIDDFKKNSMSAIFDLSDQVVQSAKLYIDASLELLIQTDPVSSNFAKAFLDNPRQFASIAFNVFTGSPDQK